LERYPRIRDYSGILWNLEVPIEKRKSDKGFKTHGA